PLQLGDRLGTPLPLFLSLTCASHTSNRIQKAKATNELVGPLGQEGYGAVQSQDRFQALVTIPSQLSDVRTPCKTVFPFLFKISHLFFENNTSCIFSDLILHLSLFVSLFFKTNLLQTYLSMINLSVYLVLYHSAVPLKIKRLAHEPERFIWAVSMAQSRCINLQTRIGALVQDSNMLIPYAGQLSSDGETFVDGAIIAAARTLPTWSDRDMPLIPSAERKAVKEL
ncbi:Protein PLASTID TRANSCRIPTIONALLY ACTIVE 14, partial [Camellia lanceoleosa]